jgi:phosphotransferase system  glucose/maltose/N-acetylglucosamine-specific IIC component
MKWGFVLELALPGVAIGLAVVLGMGETPMWILWAVLRVLIALGIARTVRRRHFAHGFLAGAIGAALAVVCGAVFFETYTAHHPEYLERAAATAPTLDPRLLLVLIALAVGIVHGIVQGALAGIASKIVTSR